MRTLILYVILCTNEQCDTFEPMSWNVQREESIQVALEECSTLANAYDTLQTTKETDCYFLKD